MPDLRYSKQIYKDGKYEKFLENLATQYAETICDQAPSSSSQLLSPIAQKNRYKEEFKNNVRLEDLKKYLVQAVSILINEGAKFLDKPVWQNLQNELIYSKNTLSELSFKDNLPEILYPSLGISDQSLSAIDFLSKELYRRQEYSKSASLNVLLITLNGTESKYWYNLGMSFQEAENYDKAILAYACCRLLDSENIGACLFSAECYLYQDNKEEAKLELKEGERLFNHLSDKTLWDSFIINLKACIEK
jgi:hypothetical protein